MPNRIGVFLGCALHFAPFPCRAQDFWLHSELAQGLNATSSDAGNFVLRQPATAKSSESQGSADSSDRRPILKYGLGDDRGPLNAFSGDVAFSPDSRWVATAFDDGVGRIFSMTTGVERPMLKYRLTESTGRLNAIAFAADSRWVATAGVDRVARIYWMTSGKRPPALKYTLVEATDELNAITASPDTRWAATASRDGIGRIYSLPPGGGPPALKFSLAGGGGSLNAITFSPDSRWVATASADGTGHIYSMPSGDGGPTLKFRLTDSTRWLYAITFSPDSRWVATASEDNSSRIYLLPSGDNGISSPVLGFTLTDATGPLVDVAFSSAASLVATAGADGIGRIYSMTPLSLGGNVTLEWSLATYRFDIPGALSAITFSADSRWVATANIFPQGWGRIYNMTPECEPGTYSAEFGAAPCTPCADKTFTDVAASRHCLRMDYTFELIAFAVFLTLKGLTVCGLVCFYKWQRHGAGGVHFAQGSPLSFSDLPVGRRWYEPSKEQRVFVFEIAAVCVEAYTMVALSRTVLEGGNTSFIVTVLRDLSAPAFLDFVVTSYSVEFWAACTFPCVVVCFFLWGLYARSHRTLGAPTLPYMHGVDYLTTLKPVQLLFDASTVGVSMKFFSASMCQFVDTSMGPYLLAAPYIECQKPYQTAMAVAGWISTAIWFPWTLTLLARKSINHEIIDNMYSFGMFAAILQTKILLGTAVAAIGRERPLASLATTFSLTCALGIACALHGSPCRFGVVNRLREAGLAVASLTAGAALVFRSCAELSGGPWLGPPMAVALWVGVGLLALAYATCWRAKRLGGTSRPPSTESFLARVRRPG